MVGDGILKSSLASFSPASSSDSSKNNSSENTFRIFYDKLPRRLFNFEALKCGAYWETALNRGRHLFQRKRNYSREVSKLCNFLFEYNEKYLPLCYIALLIPELLVNFQFL